ncbi:hypothetical protein [Corynebacterium sp.]|uniref:hypothetical protein n=1 Tax=Corynebacterium sp. TaxID=1720 RepID=UPI0026DB26F1|nr:hypothetical protein [Corynebacterium sp.]MDO4915886.1 hypothetical protein [Corynebacterium sp.]
MSDAGFVQDVVNDYVATQPWWERRKNTIIAVAGLVLQVAQVVAVYAAGGPQWASVALAGVIGVCEALMHATAKGAVTPSMGPRLGDVAAQVTAPVDHEPVFTSTALPLEGEEPTVADYYSGKETAQ